MRIALMAMTMWLNEVAQSIRQAYSLTRSARIEAYLDVGANLRLQMA